MSVIQRMLQIVEYKGISKRKFYEEIGLSNGYLDKEREVGHKKLESICSAYPEISPIWLLTGKGSMLLSEGKEDISVLPIHRSKTIESKLGRQSIPLYDIQATAGIVTSFIDHQNIIDEIIIPDMPKCDGAMYVVGDSMYPLLKSGDIIFYKEYKEKTSILWGNVYILSLNIEGDNLVVVKYVQKSEKDDNHVVLVSQNQHHQPQEIHINNIQAFALVKGSVRFNFPSF